MKEKFSIELSTFFDTMILVMTLISSFPEKKEFKSRLKYFLLYKAYPICFFLFWLPLIVSIVMKLVQFVNNEEWEELIDVMHLLILAVNALYVVFAIQMTSVNFKNTMDNVKKYFTNSKKLTLGDLKLVIILWIMSSLAFALYVGGTMYYGGLLVRMWFPYHEDNNLPWLIYLGVWLYQVWGGVSVVLVYGFIAPFTIPMTQLVIKELSFLIRKLEDFEFCEDNSKGSTRKFHLRFRGDSYDRIRKKKFLGKSSQEDSDHIKPLCNSEEETKRFIKDFCEYHRNIKNVVGEISRIYKYEFVTQLFFTITHTCFLAFTMYYSQDQTKIMVKATPLLAVSYYVLFIYCWNGQLLADKCKDLHFAIYSCRWYNTPQSFKRSLLLLMQFYSRPFQLTGGGIIVASARTFLKGMEQSMSYILILKAMTPNNPKPN